MPLSTQLPGGAVSDVWTQELRNVTQSPVEDEFDIAQRLGVRIQRWSISTAEERNRVNDSEKGDRARLLKVQNSSLAWISQCQELARLGLAISVGFVYLVC